MKHLTLLAFVFCLALDPIAAQVASQSNNPFVVPRKATFRAALADLSADTPVHIQLASRVAVFTYDWDFETNSYREEWRTNSTLIYSRAVTRN